MVKRENIDELSIGASDRILNIEGNNLAIDTSGNLNASGGGGGGEGHLVEGFEDNDLSGYEGDTAAFGIVAGDIVGGNMLQFDGSTNDSANAIATNNVTTQRGMAYSTFVRTNTSSSMAAGMIVCATISSGTVTEGYNINFRAGSGTFAISYKTSSGGWVGTDIDSAAVTIGADTLYRIDVALSPAYIMAELVDIGAMTSIASLSSTSADATAYDSGAWGYYGASSSTSVANFDMGLRTPDIWVV